MAKEYRVVGCPGCGKTRYLTKQARRAVEVHGPDRVVVCSLTKAAAREAAGRGSGVARQNIGTLHSLCYRMLGAPPLVNASFIDGWNVAHPSRKVTVACGAASTEKGEALDVGDAAGDALLREVELLRARCEPQESWDTRVRAFHDAWEAAKREAGMIDFTDMIDLAPDEPPAGTRVLLVDEAQDHSALEMRKLRAWADHVETFVVVGDPYQAIYSWRGSDPHVLSGEIHKVLGQSWRVPRAVQREALAIIRRSSDWREDIVYAPRDEDGTVLRSVATYRNPDALVEALDDVPEGESTMFLASCDYMLDPLKGALRAAGLPYHNPYTHRWNPIGEKAIARIRALLRFAAPRWGGPEPEDFVWTLAELREWLPLLREAPSLDSDRGALLRGVGREALEALGDATDEAQLRRWIREHVARRAVTALMDGDIEWLVGNLLAAPGRALSYPLAVITHRGWSALIKEPRVVLGTIHSAKGGECEHVVLFPDLSNAGARQLGTPGWAERDAIYRMLYVGMTRARASLTLARRASEQAVRF